MTNEEIAYMLKYSSPNSMLVIWKNGRLEELNCPFEVRVVKPIGLYKKNQVLTVSAIKVTNNLITVYIISGLAYHYYHFDIMDIV